MLSATAIGIVGLSATAFAIAYGRRFGDDALGLAALALAVGTGVPQVACAGLVGGLTRFVAARRGAGDGVGMRRALVRGLGACGVLGVALAVVAVATAPSWAPRIGLPTPLVVPAALLIALECAYFGIKAALYGLGRVTDYAVLEALGGAAFATVLVAVLVGAPLPAIAPFLGADVLMVALGLAALWRPTAEASAPPPSQRRVAAMAPVPGSMTRWVAIAYLGTAASLARLRLPVLIAGAAAAAADVGHLHAAFAFFAPLMLAPRALELALLPSLATAYGMADRAALRLRTTAATAAVAAAMAVLGGALLLGSAAILDVLFGTPFASAAPALVAVVVGAWLVGLASPSVVALAGADGIAWVSASGVAGLVASVVAWRVAVPALGATGAAVGFAVGSLVVGVLPILVARRRYGVALGPSAVITARALGLLALAALASARFAPAEGTARLLAQLGIAAGYAIAAALAARGPLLAVIARRRTDGG